MKEFLKNLGVRINGTNYIKQRNKDITKIVKSLEASDLLIKGVSQTIENKTEKQRSGLLNMLLGALGAKLLENLLSGKRVIRPGNGLIRAGNGIKTRKYF